jgi:hypothetical protein
LQIEFSMHFAQIYFMSNSIQSCFRDIKVHFPIILLNKILRTLVASKWNSSKIFCTYFWVPLTRPVILAILVLDFLYSSKQLTFKGRHSGLNNCQMNFFYTYFWTFTIWNSQLLSKTGDHLTEIQLIEIVIFQLIETLHTNQLTEFHLTESLDRIT